MVENATGSKFIVIHLYVDEIGHCGIGREPRNYQRRGPYTQPAEVERRGYDRRYHQEGHDEPSDNLALAAEVNRRPHVYGAEPIDAGLAFYEVKRIHNLNVAGGKGRDLDFGKLRARPADRPGPVTISRAGDYLPAATAFAAASARASACSSART